MGALNWGHFLRSRRRVFVSLRPCRSELSVEKTSVLQSELDSCNQLQELEPLNKCKLSVCVCVCALVPSDYAVVCGSFLARVFTDRDTPDEGARSFRIWKRDTGSFSNSESKWRAVWIVQPRRLRTDRFYPLFQEVDPMRSAYYSDLCSKFMIENTILKMEYAEVRVFSIADKVGLELVHDIEIVSFFFSKSWILKPRFLSEPDHLVPPGPTVTGDPHQPVVQSAGAAPSSVCHVAVPWGRTLEIAVLQGPCRRKTSIGSFSIK